MIGPEEGPSESNAQSSPQRMQVPNAEEAKSQRKSPRRNLDLVPGE
jgi:hypothetical protein